MPDKPTPQEQPIALLRQAVLDMIECIKALGSVAKRETTQAAEWEHAGLDAGYSALRHTNRAAQEEADARS